MRQQGFRVKTMIRAAQEKFQYREFLWQQLQFYTFAFYNLGGNIDLQIADRQIAWTVAGRAAHEGV